MNLRDGEKSKRGVEDEGRGRKAVEESEEYEGRGRKAGESRNMRDAEEKQVRSRGI
jgi:hypothetical protein